MCLSAGLILTAVHDVYSNQQEQLTINIEALTQLLGVERLEMWLPIPKRSQAGGAAAEFGLDASDPFPSVCLWLF